LKAEVFSVAEAPSKFDITLYVEEQNDDIRLSAVYNAALFQPERIAEMLEQLRHLLTQAVENPDRPFSHCSLVTPGATTVLPDPCVALTTHDEKSIPALFALQASRTPDRLAIASEQDYMYGELDALSNQLANHLRAVGIRRQDIVAVYGDRS